MRIILPPTLKARHNSFDVSIHQSWCWRDGNEFTRCKNILFSLYLLKFVLLMLLCEHYMFGVGSQGDFFCKTFTFELCDEL
jgi:hypothetical protein